MGKEKADSDKRPLRSLARTATPARKVRGSDIERRAFAARAAAEERIARRWWSWGWMSANSLGWSPGRLLTRAAAAAMCTAARPSS